MKNITLAILCILALGLEAQKSGKSVEFEFSDELLVNGFAIIPDNQTERASVFIGGAVSSGFLKYDLFIYKINKRSLKVEAEVQYKPEVFKGRSAPFSRRMWGDKQIEFYSGYNKETDIQSLIMLDFDANNLKQGKFKSMYELKSKKRGENIIKSKWAVNDSLVLAYSVLETEKDENKQLAVRLMDHHFETKFEATLDLERKSKKFTVNDIELLNNGSIIMLCSQKRKSSEKGSSKESDYEYYLYKLNIESQEFEEYSLGLSKQPISDIFLTVDEAGDQVVLSGLYMDKYRLAGSFFGLFNDDPKQAAEITLHPFDKKFNQDFLRSSDAKAASTTQKGGLRTNFSPVKVFTLSNGTYTAVYEEYYVKEVTTRTNNSTMTTYYYNYGPAVYFNYTEKGELNYSGVAPKMQTTTNDDGVYSGVGVLKNGNQIHLFWNDNPKNLARLADPTKQPKGIKKGAKKSVLAMFTINEDGMGTYEHVGVNPFKNMAFLPRFGTPVSLNSNELFIPMTIGKKAMRLARITVE